MKDNPSPLARFKFLKNEISEQQYSKFPGLPKSEKVKYWGKVIFKDEDEAVLLTKRDGGSKGKYYSIISFLLKKKRYKIIGEGESYMKTITGAPTMPGYKKIATELLDDINYEGPTSITERQFVFCLMYPYFEVEFPNFNRKNYKNNTEVNNLFLRLTYLLNNFKNSPYLDVALYNFKLFNETEDIRSAYMSFREIIESMLKIKIEKREFKENFPRNRINYLQESGFDPAFIDIVDKYINDRNKFAHLNNTKFIEEVKLQFSTMTKLEMTQDLLYFINALATVKKH